ncbi:bifunctional adenosylcobinamide kinase/adenosylcobinamide-phosphate guanylyltransferase [uncultured Thiodictyon sp.]|uniref:bifunctional adenosylcobinamide kinase/adenosylcobinamide-phosphate guanylyltransferase n=1 Tax=uncultured Thiodictyon sp. TaxID=1846217 RepID=UPI0025E8DB89|nr:bifunctional adenosylcobinamide kinase/adenosylcobinamide-phosphate guanylyltransferase [uncultured Thiodictyon sp.]
MNSAAASRTLVLGGVRSGKSRFAEGLARAAALPVTYIATARGADGEMARRIAEHQRRRPAAWDLVEEPLALAEALAAAAAPGRCVLVECLTLWITNLLVDETPGRIEREFEALLGIVERSPGRVILVGNETNMGVTPLGELSRRYCDLAGGLHQALAERCDQVILVVAGLPLVLKGPVPIALPN